jgi:hypothetical protein
MADKTNYQEYAAQCIRQAKEATAPEQKALLLMMAQAWERLEKQSERFRSLLANSDADGTA